MDGMSSTDVWCDGPLCAYALARRRVVMMIGMAEPGLRRAVSERGTITSWFTVHGSRFTVHGSRFTVH
eukprot:1837811-Rhodomonas_salina.2